jgi:hypothetical protein
MKCRVEIADEMSAERGGGTEKMKRYGTLSKSRGGAPKKSGLFWMVGCTETDDKRTSGPEYFRFACDPGWLDSRVVNAMKILQL